MATRGTLIERSRSVDVPAFLDMLADAQAQYDDVLEALPCELEDTARVCGSAPDPSALDSAALGSCHHLDRWLLDWELGNGRTGDPSEMRLEWFTPDTAFVIFLPTSSSWETLAYLNWCGTNCHGTEYFIALGKSWEQRFGAELVADYGTMLQCLVSRPPADPHEAWELAREHDLAAPSNLALPGLPMRHYARGLVGHDRWFLHERP